MLFYRTTNKKIHQSIWTFVIGEKSTKTRLDAEKSSSKKVVRKAAEARGELTGNKITRKIVKPKPLTYINSGNVEGTVVLTEKVHEILNELRQIL